jgi:3-phenylpropionate/cinnamic acid dioxygenase small subunit
MATVETENSHRALRSDQRIRAGDPLHAELHELLDDEAALLDSDRLPEWLGMLADDLVYRAPVRLTRNRADGLGFSATMAHFDDTYASLVRRVKRATESPNAWAVDPPSRVRRHVSNVRVYRSQEPDEYRVLSYVLAVRSHSDVPALDVVSAERDDLVRRTTQGWRLARRDIYLVQSALGVPNLAFFL